MHRFRNIEITRVEISMANLKQTLRVVAVSDLHASSISSYLQELVKIINNELPDIFILVGDIIDRRGEEGMVDSLKRVEAKLAKVAVLGNWEYKSKLDLEKLKSEYMKAGVSLLINAAIELNGMIVFGLDDFIGGSPDYELLRYFCADGHPVLVLSHCPEIFIRLANLSLPRIVLLSGHIHGGQIAPFGVVLFKPRGSGPYIHGWYQKGSHSLYVMRGVGTNTIPLRIGARPEILVLDIKE